MHTLTFYTNGSETFYTVGPYETEELAVAHANHFHTVMFGGISNVSITRLNPTHTDHRDLQSETVYFDDAGRDESYHLIV